MTKLNYTLSIDDSCNLTLVDNTGFYDPSTNVTGFLTEGDTSSPVFGVYKLSQGYFINVLLYNKYNVSPIIANASEGFYQCPLPISPTYADNFASMIYNLTNDGTYTMKRFFIISDVYYEAISGNGILDGKDVYYTDGTTIMYTDGTTDPAPVTISVFLSGNMANATVLETDISFISTCKLNACYFKLMNVILDYNMSNCTNPAYDKLVQNKDLIYMTLESIKYMQEQNALTQIQKLIEAVDGCCSICQTKIVNPMTSWASTSSTAYSTKGGCGCG